MRGFVIHTLKCAVVAAVLLAGVGFVMAAAAGLWLDNQPRPTGRDAPIKSNTSFVGSGLTTRMPLGMAAWGFVTVVAFESVRLGLRRSLPAKPPTNSTAAPLPKPLTADLTETPIPRGCPKPVEADNTSS
jgi:hypothetical protein